MPSSAPLVKAALISVLAGLFPVPIKVSYGTPGPDQPDSLVLVNNQHVQLERPTSGTNRPREEIVETEVVFSVFVGGGDEMRQTATEAAYALASTFSDYFKTKPNETLGGACREAWVTAYDLSEETSVDPTTGWVTGQVAEITATVTSKARI